jgi:hypothetical protein
VTVCLARRRLCCEQRQRLAQWRVRCVSVQSPTRAAYCAAHPKANMARQSRTGQGAGLHTPDPEDERNLDALQLVVQVVLDSMHRNFVQEALRNVVVPLDVVVRPELVLRQSELVLLK